MIEMVTFRKSLLLAVLVVMGTVFSNPSGLNAAPAQATQNAAADSDPDAASSTDAAPSPFRFGFPSSLTRRIVGQIALGGVREGGMVNLSETEVGSPATTWSADGSAGVAYDLRRNRSDWVFDYRVSVRRYPDAPRLNTVTQDAGFVQTISIGKQTELTFNYRFTLTPDLSGRLIGESLSQQLALPNTQPVGGQSPGQSQYIDIVPPIVTSAGNLGARLSPADGIFAFRSKIVTHSAQTTLSKQFGIRTKLTFTASGIRDRSDGGALFGSNSFDASLSLGYLFGPNTTAGIAIKAGRSELVQAYDRKTYGNASLFIGRQLGRRNTIVMYAGPSNVLSQGEASIPLPPLLAELLGRTALVHRESNASIGWMGGAQFSSQLFGTAFNLGYTRALQQTGGLSGAGLAQIAVVGLGKRIAGTTFSASYSYNRTQLIGIENGFNLLQRGITVSLTRHIIRSVDFSASFLHAKLPRSLAQTNALDQNQVRMQLVIQIPRLVR